MTTHNSSAHHTSEWTALQSHHDDIADLVLRDAFFKDPERYKTLSCSIDGLVFDYSKQLLTTETMRLMCSLARAQNLEHNRDEMFAGAHVNQSEDRPALHAALRDPDCALNVDDEDIGEFVRTTQAHMQKLSSAVRDGTLRGYTGEVITDIVNIGIGGSDLGPNVVFEALKGYAKPDLNVHFLSSIDARHLVSVLGRVNPATTLFIVASKTFTTQETMINAQSAKAWITDHINGAAVEKHFIGVTTNIDAAREFGISDHMIVPLRPWVGGRYSVWSAIGLPICLAYGFSVFSEFLSGAHAMDAHFKTAPLEHNLPVLMGLISIWNRNFKNFEANAILPYAYDLRPFPDYIQQLSMESGGKSVTQDGADLDIATAPVLFGDHGPSAQHAFFQALHQSKTIIPCEFIGVICAYHDYDDHHEKLLANMIGQAQALMSGQDNEIDQARHFPGNRPSSTLLLERLDPYHLGVLMATYEHKTFVECTLWGINAFDQWGVELGKRVTNSILENTQNPNFNSSTPFDSSTQGLLDTISVVKNKRA